jgi:beta-galactosidase GanA
VIGNRFPYGASYSPLIYAEEEWERDMSLMRDASMNLVRIGDVHGSWDRIEPREGVFEFPLLENFYKAANKLGIDILLSTGTSSPPLWLAMKYPDISLLSSRGERYPLGASYHWACIHHPQFLNAAEGYVTRLAEFVMRHPNHFGWQISNEIGFPFMPAREKNELGLYCYCEHCQRVFREWVQKKYRTLDALTYAWSWGTTNFVYNDWDEIFGPESLPASWSGVTRWIDWRLFWQEAFANFAGWQHNLIRAIDAEHPTSVNTFNFKGYDRFGTFMGLDQWKIAEQVDHIGYDLYPGSGDKRATRPEHNSIFLDHGRSVSESTRKDYWIHEVESGPIGGWLLGPNYNTDENDILNNNIEALGHNAKLILFMPWREWGYQPIRWGALVGLDGSSTPRLNAAAKLGKFIQENAEFFKKATVPQSEVAILESKPNAIFMRGVHQEEILFNAQRGAYRAFWEQGFSVDFITPKHLEMGNLTKYRYICLPLLGLLPENHTELLEDYVHGGGILIGFARLAALDENGWYHFQYPLKSIRNIFGIDQIEPDTLNDNKVIFNDQIYDGALNRDIVEIIEGTEVLYWFSDGHPAVTRARLGDGFGVYICTQADVAFLDNPEDNLLAEIIKLVNSTYQIQPRFWVDGNFNRSTGIDPHLLETSEKSLILFSNYSANCQTASFSLRLNDQKPEAIRQVFPEHRALTFHCERRRLTTHLQFEEKEVKVIEVKWK